MKNEIIEAGETLPVQTEEQSLMQMIYQAAKDPDFDADKMDKIIGMKERMDDREAKKAFNRALVEFKKNPPRIIKNMAVSFGNTKYSHATIDSVCRQLDPVLFDLGLAFRWNVQAADDKVRVVCVLSHVDGYSEESFMQDVGDSSGSKNALQGKGSTITYLKRYTLLAALGLAEQGQDDDGLKAHMKKAVDDEQTAEILALIEKAETTAKAVCAFFKVGSVPELSNEQYGAAVHMLNAKIRKFSK